MRRADDMSKERAPRPLLPEGWRAFIVANIEEATSKSGNEMFIVSLKDKETESILDVYCIATPGKRWLLKSLLVAAGIKAGENGVYEWDPDELLETEIMGKVKVEDEEWINREGVTVTTPKSKIVDFKSI